MATLVSTGQITIIDTNDARSITAVLIANNGTQQIYTKDESTVNFVPSWFSSALVLTPKIAVGGMTESQAWARLTNKQFSLTQNGTPIVSGTTSASFCNNSDADVTAPFTVTHGAVGASTVSTMSIGANLKSSVNAFTVFFDADFTDPSTNLTTHITCQITLTTVKTGTNAVFISMRGKNSIEQATGSTKSFTVVAADLVRSSGIDTSGLTYKWYVGNAGTQVTTTTPASSTTKYGLKTTSGLPTAVIGDIGQNLPTAGNGNAHNTLVISEIAVTDMDVIRVDIADSDAKTYSQYFTIYDITDPYDVKLNSSTGDKLQNGQGSTTITPQVFYGATNVASLTGWSFSWYFYDKNGKRAGFVDTGKISQAGGGDITANTTGASASFSSALITAGMFVAGELIKCVKPNGDAYYYEVGATSTAGNVAIRTPVTNAWLTFANFPAPSASTDFVGGAIYGCTAQGTRTTTNGTGITVTGDEIDVKGTIFCEANRP